MQKIIKVYDSATEASKETQISRGNIGSYLLGNRKSAGGYIWKYDEK